jgi:hypothetical protein
MTDIEIETHPLQPFLPHNAKLLMLEFSTTSEPMENGFLLSKLPK